MRSEERKNRENSYSRAELIDIIEYPEDGKAILLFSVEDWGEDYVLPICIDSSIAFSIRKAIENIPFPRPLTHDLLVNILEKLDATVEKVTIDAMIGNIYVATIVLRDNRTNTVFHIDARPSDATAIAVRTGAPIYIANHLKKYAQPYSYYKRLKVILRGGSPRTRRTAIETEEEEEDK